jgi:hypothetical protein
MLEFLSEIAKVAIVVILTGAVILGSAFVGFTLGESNGKVIGFHEAMDKINGFTTEELCSFK